MFLRSLTTFSFILLLLLELVFAGIPLSSRYGVYDGKVRVVFELPEGAKFRIYSQDEEGVVFVEIRGVKDTGKLVLPAFWNWHISKHDWGVRVGLHHRGNIRVKYLFLRNPNRLVIDIYREKRVFPSPERRQEVELAATHGEKDPLKDFIVRLLATPVIDETKVIVIDAGHGGKDPGAIGYGGLKEKYINLSIAKLLAQYLRKDGRFKVILTRRGDYFVPLHKRAKIALLNRADLFISIHSDAAPKGRRRAKGTQIFALSYKRAIEKKRQIVKNDSYAKLVLGKAVNSGSPVVKKILADLAIDVTLYESVQFGKTVALELKSVLKREVHFKGIRRAGFAVLKTPGIPSVLIETAFITNPEEAKRLANPEFRKKLAWAIYRAVVRYFYGEDYNFKLVKY